MALVRAAAEVSSAEPLGATAKYTAQTRPPWVSLAWAGVAGAGPETSDRGADPPHAAREAATHNDEQERMRPLRGPGTSVTGDPLRTLPTR